MAVKKDAFEIGNFGFYKDADLKHKMNFDQLYDQVDAEGNINLWFGGHTIWIPSFGDFEVYISCQETFFWDIVDENGKRTKDMFRSMHILYNNRMEARTGDLIPLNKEEVFDYTYENPSLGINPLICSNLWFYTNKFTDEYYRYNLMLHDVADGNIYPDELHVRNVPMNDTLTIHENEFIMGYRPKIEYMNQLAVVKTLATGKENAILFRLAVDLDKVAVAPDTRRKIRVFAQSNDTVTYTLYPKSQADILWISPETFILNEYQRYLLEYGVMEYLPNASEILYAEKLFDKFMKSSNLIVQAGDSYQDDIASDMRRIMDGEDLNLAGYSALIKDDFLDWLKENDQTDIVRTSMKIIRRVVLTRKYYKGFAMLADKMNIANTIPGVESPQSWVAPPIGPDIPIINMDGIFGYVDGYLPTSAKEYLTPKRGYQAATNVSGYYYISIAMQKRAVFCDMLTDGGGWMTIIAGSQTSTDYLSQFGDVYFIKNLIYRDASKGIGWGAKDGGELGFQMYNLPFAELYAEISGDYDFGIGGDLSFYTASGGHVVKFSTDDFGQDLNVGGVGVFRDRKEVITSYPIMQQYGQGEMNSLTIKTSSNSFQKYAKRYINILKVR